MELAGLAGAQPWRRLRTSRGETLWGFCIHVDLSAGDVTVQTFRVQPSCQKKRRHYLEADLIWILSLFLKRTQGAVRCTDASALIQKIVDSSEKKTEGKHYCSVLTHGAVPVTLQMLLPPAKQYLS